LLKGGLGRRGPGRDPTACGTIRGSPSKKRTAQAVARTGATRVRCGMAIQPNNRHAVEEDAPFVSTTTGRAAAVDPSRRIRLDYPRRDDIRSESENQ
jgi:hypothetical protein